MAKPTRQKTLAILDALLGGPAEPPTRLALQLQSLKAEHRHWIGDRRIIGYGFPGKGGYFSNAKSSPKMAIYVNHEDDVSSLAEDVPDTLFLPGLDGPIGTEIVNIGEVRPLANPYRIRPLICGSSVSHQSMEAGTLGGIVTRRDEPDNTHYILSNNHVLTEYNKLKIGDPILQPGTSDKGRATDKVAELTHFIKLIYGDREFPNRVDAALARIVGDDCLHGDMSTKVVSGVTREPRRGERVRIFGRTSGLSVGQVMDVSARVAMFYPRDSESTSRVGFSDVVLCTRMSQPGDSGSLVENDSGKVLGLMIGGSSKVSIFCKIGYLLEMLAIDKIRVIR